MTYYKVTNRTTRKTQIFNASEYANFFGYLGNGKYRNDFSNYAVSTTLNPKDKAFNSFLDSLAFACFGLAFIILITEIVRDNFTIL
tara:strand:- start:869 stop:1126 length:258 start_codon:yes stop_codon:yes gene_type:complete